MVLGYNRPFAHPTSSFNEPVLPPSVEPDEGEQVQVCFAVGWLPYVLGALSQLLLQSTWQGDPADVLLAQGRATNLLGLFANPVCATSEIEAPFWDDTSGDDSDDEESEEEQPWYGIWDGETFVESLSYWAVTAFLATGISEGAAIEFISPLRTFRLTLRKNPHGAKLLVFMDSNIFQLIDLFGSTDEVVTVPIASPGSTLMLVHSGEHNEDATPDENGNYVVDVIRGRLAESDVTDVSVRYSGTPPVFQMTNDNGMTWVDSPAADPRYNPRSFFPPLTPYTGIECDVATRMSAQLKDSINAMCAAGDAAQAVTAILEIILLPTGLLGDLLSLLFIIADWIIDEGQATILAAFTDAVYDDIACILRCFIESDGSITQDNLDAAWEQVKIAHSGTVATVVDEIRFLFTDAVFSNAGVKRTETGDCSACDDCEGCHYWTDIGNTSVDATYVYRQFQSSLSPNVAFTQIDVEYTLHPNAGGTDTYKHLLVYFNGSGTVENDIELTSNHDTITLTYPTHDLRSGFNIILKHSHSTGANYPDMDTVTFHYINNTAISWSGGADC